ncbi:zinc ribbon domain-containing protein [Paenibacillus frigoriresistens]|uniref:zinc-ribbon domain-containing protein n=1 Tax=Paenibacillus alginolyticus TaxID=59839 RepID=UPI00156579A0|nr:zinc ribbon domain-containing protein [Paenibacillus frigoriresistens]
MYCSKCGTELNTNALFCHSCGTSIQQYSSIDEVALSSSINTPILSSKSPTFEIRQ